MYDVMMNYFIIPSVISMASFAVFAVVNPVLAGKVVREVSWQSVRIFTTANIFIERVADKYTERYASSSSEEEDSEYVTNLSYFDTKQNTMIFAGSDHNDISRDWWDTNKDNIGFFMLTDDNDLIKISQNYDDLVCGDDWSAVEKPFVQVELVQSNNTLDIHDKLKDFYVEGNVILDTVFLKWYVGNFFDTELEPDYMLKIFDKDVNLFEINSDQMVRICKDGYKILNSNESVVEDDNTSMEETETNLAVDNNDTKEE